MSKPRWQKQTLKLRKNHNWTGTPGYVVFVADRGAARFEVPQDWIITPGDDSIRFYDKQPPDDDCLLQFSLLRLNPQIDWTGLPLQELFNAAFQGDDREKIARGEPTHERRADLELIWREDVFLDPKEQREARECMCLTRSGTIMPFLTFVFWPEHEERARKVWAHVLKTLRLGQYVADPRVGPRRGGYG
jgi:hypothetical protein